MIITRFSPTVNGSLHLGHAFTLIVNEQFAHTTDNGLFFVRFDDTSQAIRIEMSDSIRTSGIIDEQKNDINWLGIEVNGWSKQSNLTDEVETHLAEFRLPLIPDSHPHYLPVIIKSGNTCIPYPYTPYQTLERVIMDHILGVTHLIRGEDFISEYSLYRYFCELLGYKFPEFIFLPRLMGKMGDISKTNGGYKISDLRSNGYAPHQVINILKKACLYYPENGWGIHNLRPNPQLDI